MMGKQQWETWNNHICNNFETWQEHDFDKHKSMKPLNLSKSSETFITRWNKISTNIKPHKHHTRKYTTWTKTLQVENHANMYIGQINEHKGDPYTYNNKPNQQN